jgi:hypothetical protein
MDIVGNAYGISAVAIPGSLALPQPGSDVKFAAPRPFAINEISIEGIQKKRKY